ncbi:hypothetical protein I549_2958 [Mycobacterium avium subsp. avium 2285 (R)]|uniref:Uncharacterized protein n=1 Tax=Mycobacterium avium (strain 104) TaxID=243243 RepID=A0A0H3A0S6_MYCA1|nr:hypothetical protein MAV_3267 [Mycobacterium avium 104]ETZ51009.1 hypothetical protein L837_1777 [Mycobacterium avium MAV_061107_1842]EUA40044.1 hypothetical protein I549_2958 [Mycobacterium avium subsp. avium 2285 (R)]
MEIACHDQSRSRLPPGSDEVSVMASGSPKPSMRFPHSRYKLA